MLKLKIHNDGKNKHQSFEVSLDDSESTAYLIGYGENVEEGKEQLKKQIEKYIQELQSIDFEKFDWVDCFGNKLNLKYKK